MKSSIVVFLVAVCAIMVMRTWAHNADRNQFLNVMQNSQQLGAKYLPPGDRQEYYVEHEGVNRSFIIYTPTTVDPNVNSPLVMTIHFYGGAPELMALYTLMDSVAEDNRFIVVYPRGTDRSFNAGPICCGDTSRDDVSFIRKIVAQVATLRRIDLRRVYATGQSNGGYMSYRLACDASDLFAAIAPVSGSSPWPLIRFLDNCKPSRPMNILGFHGEDDNTVRYDDGIETIQYWLQLNSCSNNPSLTFQGSSTFCESWTVGCTSQPNGSRTNVTYCTSRGAGHIYWPGSPVARNPNDIDASREIWRFFSQFSL